MHMTKKIEKKFQLGSATMRRESRHNH